MEIKNKAGKSHFSSFNIYEYDRNMFPDGAFFLFLRYTLQNQHAKLICLEYTSLCHSANIMGKEQYRNTK